MNIEILTDWDAVRRRAASRIAEEARAAVAARGLLYDGGKRGSYPTAHAASLASAEFHGAPHRSFGAMKRRRPWAIPTGISLTCARINAFDILTIRATV